MLAEMLYAMTPGRERCDHICRLCDINARPQEFCPVEAAAVANEPELTHGCHAVQCRFPK
jgi:hypothetical protein